MLFRLIYHICLGLFLLFRFFTKAGYRSELYYGFRYVKRYHQRSSFTLLNRYPRLFTICQHFFEGRKQLRILSFGCSTGEEVESLGGHFPEAHITGTDINKRSIRIARTKYGSETKNFIHSLSSGFQKLENFDMVFCCAVFQSTANRTSHNNQISDWAFEQFEASLQMLDQKLSKGGLLVIDHCDFRFVDTSCAEKYETLDVANNRIQRDRPTYDRHNQKISEVSENDRVFVKIRP
ncbi:MAG: class I SAM-dependent methyltransferase [Roseivirga sp.]|nr:class I SAM-dependent methyltransferase [Roseivirga sp.]